MKLVRFNYIKDKDIGIYWIKQFNPLTLTNFTAVGFGGKFSFKKWLEFQKLIARLWLVGKTWTVEDSQSLFEKH